MVLLSYLALYVTVRRPARHVQHSAEYFFIMAGVAMSD